MGQGEDVKKSQIDYQSVTTSIFQKMPTVWNHILTLRSTLCPWQRGNFPLHQQFIWAAHGWKYSSEDSMSDSL